MFKHAFFILSLCIMSVVNSMECDYKFLNKRAKAYALALINNEEVRMGDLMQDLQFLDMGNANLPAQKLSFQSVIRFRLSGNVENFYKKCAETYNKLTDKVKEFQFLLLTGNIFSEIERGTDSSLIMAGPVD